jgi:hypothetical protein
LRAAEGVRRYERVINSRDDFAWKNQSVALDLISKTHRSLTRTNFCFFL